MRTTLTARLIVLLLLSSSVLVSAQESTPVAEPWTGSTEQKVWGLMTVWAEARYAFPHFDRLPGLDWDQAAQEYIPRVIAAGDERSYYRVLMEFVALLHDSHTSIMPPWGPLTPGYDLPPLEVQVIEGRFMVTRVGESPEIKNQRIYPGLEIVEIDSRPVSEYFAQEVLRYHTRGSKQADEAVLTIYMLYGPQGEKVGLRVRDIDGGQRNVVLTRNSTQEDGSPFMYRFLYNIMAAETIDSRMIENDILYVDIPHFESPVVAEDFRALIDALDPSKVSGVIVDLRYNMGGSSRTCSDVVSCLIDEPVAVPITRYRQYAAAEKAWGLEPTWLERSDEIKPRDGERYLGPLVVLSGPTTNSSAEDFIIELQHSGRARIVGERTSGGAGNPLVCPLPGGGTFRVSTFTAIYPGGDDYVGIGVTPDVVVHPTRKDVYRATDPVLSGGIEVIRDWKSPDM